MRLSFFYQITALAKQIRISALSDFFGHSRFNLPYTILLVLMVVKAEITAAVRILQWASLG